MSPRAAMQWVLVKCARMTVLIITVLHVYGTPNVMTVDRVLTIAVVHLAPIVLTAVCEIKQRAILILAAQDLPKEVERRVLERLQHATI